MKKEKGVLTFNWLYLIIYVALIVLFWALVEFRLIKTSTQIAIVSVGINIILAVSLNFIIGIAGQFSLGHAGYMAVGAYATGVVTLFLPGWLGFIVSVLIGIAVSIIFSLIVAYPTVRLKGDYLAIATLGFSEIVRILILNTPITKGAAGLQGIPTFTSLPLLMAVGGAIVFILLRLVHSRFGRALHAIKDDEIASSSLGLKISDFRVLAFTIGGVFASIAGSLYAGYFGYIRPDLFDFNKSIDILVIVVLGGMGSFTGSIVAAVVLGVINIFLQNFTELRMILYALILVVMMIFKPKGLLGSYEFSLNRLMKGEVEHERT